MFGTNNIGGIGSLSLGRILSGISKTINVANQVIPLYQQAKPMISNARSALSLLKTMNTPTTTKAQSQKKIETNTQNKNAKKEETISFSSMNQPVFFV